MRAKPLLSLVFLMLVICASAATAQRSAPPRGVPPPGERQRPPEPTDDGIEQMDGPDAWELLGMGPFGLLHRGPEGPPRGGPGMRLNAFSEHQRDLEQQWGVTPAQHARIEAIIERQAKAAAVQRRSLEGMVRELQSMLRSATATRAAIELKIDAVARLRAELTKSRLRALLDTRGVLTAGQRAKLGAFGDERPPRREQPRP